MLAGARAPMIPTTGGTGEEGKMQIGPLMIGTVMALLCYLSLVETVGRGSAAAVAVYQRRAIVTSVAVGTAGAVLALLLAALG
jgi:hypothetical protein